MRKFSSVCLVFIHIFMTVLDGFLSKDLKCRAVVWGSRSVPPEWVSGFGYRPAGKFQEGTDPARSGITTMQVYLQPQIPKWPQTNPFRDTRSKVNHTTFPTANCLDQAFPRTIIHLTSDSPELLYRKQCRGNL